MDVMRESYFQFVQIKFLAESVLVFHIPSNAYMLMMNEAIWLVIAAVDAVEWLKILLVFYELGIA